MLQVDHTTGPTSGARGHTGVHPDQFRQAKVDTPGSTLDTPGSSLSMGEILASNLRLISPDYIDNCFRWYL